MVRIHAHTMRSTMVQRIAFARLANPTPMIDADTLCVVDTGIPSAEAVMITVDEAVSAATPVMGCSFTILWPSVWMMRQPPAIVPAAMTSAQVALIHVAMPKPPPGSDSTRRKLSHPGRLSIECADVPAARASAMMPIVFSASFKPCDRPMNPDDTICTFANTLLTMRGRAARPMRPPRLPRNDSSASKNPITMKPIVKPAAGETTIGRITLLSRPLPSHQCPAGIDQMIECPLVPVAASAAPQSPPIKACDELDGKPHHHVIRSQMVAPSSAQMMSSGVTFTTPESISPDEIVLATDVPHIAPRKLVHAARMTA